MGAEERDIETNQAESRAESTAHTDSAPTAEPSSGDPAPTAEPSSSDPAPTAELAPSSATRISRRRLIGVDVLIGVTTVLLVVCMFSVWANRLLFSPDNWANTSTQLLENPAIRTATANYLVDQLYANVDVPGLIKQGLPTQFQGLAAPAAGALRNAAVQGVELALARPRIQSLWAQANRAADQTFIAVVNGGKGPVGVKEGVVTLDLGSILDNVATQLGLPSNLSSRLPANIANLTVFKSNQLKTIQNGGNAIRSLALWLTIIVPLLYLLALFLARGHRRRTLMTIGFAGILAGVIVLFGRSVLQTQIANSITDDATLRPAIRATVGIGTALLSEVAGGVIFMGILLVLAAWFVGPARLASTAREAIAPFLRERPGATYAITLGVLALLFIWDPIHATGTIAGIIIFTVVALVGTEILIRQTRDEFPDARSGAAKQAVLTRVASLRPQRHHAGNPNGAGGQSTAEQLERLADLRDRGAITPDEYQTAKAQLLGR